MSKYVISVIIFLLSISSTSTAKIINVPSDSSTIQLAVNGAEPGDSIYIEPGRYYENIEIIDKDNLTIFGSRTRDENDVTIDGSGDNNKKTVKVENSLYFKLLNMDLEYGAEGFGSVTGSGSEEDKWELEYVKIKNSVSHGLDLHNFEAKLWLRHVDILGSGEYGADITGQSTAELRIENSHFFNSLLTNVKLEGFGELDMKNTIIDNSQTGNGFEFTKTLGGRVNILFDNVKSNNNGQNGWQFEGLFEFTATDITSDNNSGTGFEYTNTTELSTELSFTRFQSNSNGDGSKISGKLNFTAVDWESSNNLLGNGNTMDIEGILHLQRFFTNNNANIGWDITMTGDLNMLDGESSFNATGGIKYRKGSFGASLFGSTDFHSNSLFGLDLEWEFKNDSLFRNGADSIVDCDFQENDVGIIAEPGITAYLADNYFSGNDTGIYLFDAVDCIVINNEVSNNDYGLCLENAVNSSIIDNTVTSNGFGIYLKNAENSSVDNGAVTFNNYGIYLENAVNSSLVSNIVCENYVYDIYTMGSSGNYGMGNICDESGDWNDYGADGCTDSCNCCELPGDANGNGSLNILDITSLIAYLYQSGPRPPCMYEGDANGSCDINILDITYLIGHLYLGGPEPVCAILCLGW